MFAFVLMPFDSKFDDIYKLGIQKTSAALGITAERVDEQIFHKENILERIYNQIATADFIIADLTDRNPNVFYETGYAHAKGKTCLLLTSNADDIPFDLKHHRHIIYGTSIQNLIQNLERELPIIKAEVENRKSVIAVKLAHSFGETERSNYSVTGVVQIHFDLNNTTNAPSPEIESIYFYTGRGWSFTQDAQACASTDSDMPDFFERHFIRPPVRRLTANGWAQIQLMGKKFLDYSSSGTFKDDYKISGKTVMRIVTAERTSDYPILLDINTDEIPF
jgi:nucleoside 2-deoxyribosyltransferase